MFQLSSVKIGLRICMTILMLGSCKTAFANEMPIDGAQTGNGSELYSESYALVVGIDDYHNGWPPLSNAVADAQEIQTVLESQGYQVEFVKNLSSKELKSALRNFFVRKGANPDARLMLWFAGHGQTIKGEGFLVAADTPLENDPEFKLSAIHMRDFGSWVRLAESKHVLAVFDSCFSGTIFSAQRGKPNASVTRATTYPVRQFITSGDADQLVLDNGTFRELFVRAMRGEESADINADGFLTASELGFFLTDRITNLTNAQQTPRYGKLRDKDYDRGDFILALLNKQEAIISKSTAVQAIETENLHWQSVLEINNTQAYEAYLKRFPNGVYSDLALAKIDQFKALETKPAPTPPATSSMRSIQLQPVTTEFVYALNEADLFKAPAPTDIALATVDKGEQLQTRGLVKNQGREWLQVEWRGQLLFIDKALTIEEKPRKSMSELIAEAKLRNSSVDIQDQNLSRCLKNCEGYQYFSMDTEDLKYAEDACYLQSNGTHEYNTCLDKKKSEWKTNKRNTCEQKCRAN